MDAAHQAELASSRHDLLVEVERGLRLPDQNALLQKPPQRLARAGIYPRVVGIGVLRQIDVRSPDVEEAMGVAPRQLGSLGTVHHVVGHRRHSCGELGDGTNGVKGMEYHVLWLKESADGPHRSLAQSQPC